MSLSFVSVADRFGGRRAVILGGSMAGLLAAGVLSKHFEEVTIVERDRLPEGPHLRKGTPHARHLHGLLTRGLELLEEVFPGILSEMRAGGAVPVQMGQTFQWFHGTGLKARCEGGPEILGASRPFVESITRARVKKLSNVRLLEEHDVLGLLSSADGAGVAGARVRARSEGAEALELGADLVVDAMGRGSRAPRFLEEIGFSRPEETSLEVNVGYASRVYERPDPYPYDWKVNYVLSSPAQGGRLGMIFSVENGAWSAVVGGLLRDYPPEDEAGFLEYAKSLPSPAVYDALRSAKPVSEIFTYRFDKHVRRHYERLGRVPQGFVAVGDAVASLNPIYGQGITVAALGIEALDEALREARRKAGSGVVAGLSKRYFPKLARVLEMPWNMSTGEDLANPRVLGERPPGFALMRGYIERIHQLCQRDPSVARRFFRLMNMVDPPSALFHPGLALPVARLALGQTRDKLLAARAQRGLA